MKIALAPEGTRGDVFPLLDLGSALAEAGHRVVVCAPPGFREAVEARGVEFRAVGSDMHEILSAHAGSITRGGARLVRTAQRCAREVLERQLAELPDACADADLILGAGIQLVGPTAAELHSVPYRYVVYCPMALPSSHYPPFLIGGARLPRLGNRMAWWLTRAALGRSLGGRLSRARRALGLEPVSDLFRHLVSIRPIIAVDPELARLPDDCAIAATQVRCLHAMESEPLPEKLQHFLDAGAPPVYFGFGSMTDPEPERTTRLLVDVAEQLGVRALISQGWADYGSGPLPASVMSVGSVSHAELFPRVAAVVHHGGAGTTTMAARCGAAQIVVPHAADQHYWGRRVWELGLGPQLLPRRRLTQEALASRLRETLDSEVVQLRAVALGARLRERLDAEPPAVQLLEEFDTGERSSPA
jgi:vancomycin aglycone glucosyltransferase